MCTVVVDYNWFIKLIVCVFVGVRFPPTPGDGDMRNRSNTMPARLHGHGQVKDERVLHSVQLMPTLITGNGSTLTHPHTLTPSHKHICTHTDSTGVQHLAGISCFIANKHHGFLYDVHSKTRLVSSFSFMSKTHMVTMDTNFIHALSTDSVETYTNRVFQVGVVFIFPATCVLNDALLFFFVF